MTREEARDQIVIFMCDEQKVINDRDKQALDMAIKALSQEPSGDAISRQDAYKCLEIYGDYDTLNEVYGRLQILPSVNPQPTGHWVAVVDNWGDIVTTVNGYKCSECGEFNGFRDKFCPNCGARMESEKNG